VAVSAISVWELALLFSRGKIRGTGTIAASLRELLDGVIMLPVTQKLQPWPRSFLMIIPAIRRIA